MSHMNPEVPEWVMRQEIIPRDKRIAQLEQDNARLRETRRGPANREQLEDMAFYIENLHEENARLREERDEARQVACGWRTCREYTYQWRPHPWEPEEVKG